MSDDWVIRPTCRAEVSLVAAGTTWRSCAASQKHGAQAAPHKVLNKRMEPPCQPFQTEPIHLLSLVVGPEQSQAYR